MKIIWFQIDSEPGGIYDQSRLIFSFAVQVLCPN